MPQTSPAQSDIVLATLNAKYIHAAFGLRYLMANLGDLQSRAQILEFDIQQRPMEIAERVLMGNPKILGLGIYIWNATLTTELVALLKRLRPQLVIVLGGPEVSYEQESQAVVQLADYVIAGEADTAFAVLCRELLEGRAPSRKLIAAPLPDLNRIELPYALYSETDVSNRVVYVEASRGCPFTCEFCLSSLDVPVRQFPMEKLIPALEDLLHRGVRQFKFVDRTFNLNLNVSRGLLQFFLDRYVPGLFVHFEMIPDRLPPALREIIARYPDGALQFEVGIQTFNPDVAARIRRRQDYSRLEDNLRFLREETRVHIHADLIAGLPGESVESFGNGFDQLIRLGPQEIQVGILKRLRGTPIVRHDAEWEMIYSPLPPYEILQNRLIDFPAMQRLRRFARYWDLVGNSGNFIESHRLLWAGGRSPFQAFIEFSDWLYQRLGQNHGIALLRLTELVFEFLHERDGAGRQVGPALLRDYQRSGRSDVPAFLREHAGDANGGERGVGAGILPKRQRRHVGLNVHSRE